MCGHVPAASFSVFSGTFTAFIVIYHITLFHFFFCLCSGTGFQKFWTQNGFILRNLSLWFLLPAASDFPADTTECVSGIFEVISDKHYANYNRCFLILLSGGETLASFQPTYNKKSEKAAEEEIPRTVRNRGIFTVEWEEGYCSDALLYRCLEASFSRST